MSSSSFTNCAKCAKGVKQHSSGVKHFLRRVKKNLGGFNPPNLLPRKSTHG